MAEPCLESHESLSEGSPPPASQSQGGGSGGAEADVGRKVEEVVHLLEKLKESLKELGDDVAGIKAEVEDVHKKLKLSQKEGPARRQWRTRYGGI